MKRVYKLLAMLLIPLSSNAQQLTIDRCRKMAIENSHQLKSAQIKIAQSEDVLKAYRANRLPNFSFSGGYLYSTATLNEVIPGGYLPTFSPNPATGELTPNIVGTAPDGSPIFGSYAYMPDVTLDLEVGSLFTAGVQVAQPIYMGGKVSTAIKLAQVGVDVATIERYRSESEVIVATDKAFFTYLKVKEMCSAANAYHAVVDELYRQVEQMFKRGMCTQNELMRVQVKVNEAELAQLKAENGLNLSRMNLCYVIGIPITTTEIEVIDTFEPQEGITSSLDITSRPEYQLLKKSVEAKELEVRLAQSDFLPSVSAMANYGYTHGMKLNGETLLTNPSFSGGVKVNIPIFHWGEGRRKVSAAKREVDLAESQKADLMEKMQLELMQSINSYDEAQAQVILTERTVEQSAENLRQCNKRYTTGMESLATLLEAQALWQKAMSEDTEAKANLRITYTHYCRCKGVNPRAETSTLAR